MPNKDLSQFQHDLGQKREAPVFSKELWQNVYQDNCHWAKLANHGTLGIWVGFDEGHPDGI